MSKEMDAGQVSVCDEASVGGYSPEPLLGKFENVGELAKAYECLQSEFTRKCQQLSSLQHGQPSVGKVEMPEVAAATANRDEGKVANESVNFAPEMREAVIREYLTGVAFGRSAPAVITTAADFVCGTKPATKSVRDIRNIAENFFKTKEK